MLKQYFKPVVEAVVNVGQSYLYKTSTTQDSNACATRLAGVKEYAQNLMQTRDDIGGIMIGTGEHTISYYKKEQGVIDFPGREIDKSPIKSDTVFLNKTDSVARHIQSLQNLPDFEATFLAAKDKTLEITPGTEVVAKGLQEQSWANNIRRKFSESKGLTTPAKGASNREMLDTLSKAMLSHAQILADNTNAEENNSGRDYISVKVTGEDDRSYLYVFPDFEQERFLDNMETLSGPELLEAYAGYISDKIEDADAAIEIEADTKQRLSQEAQHSVSYYQFPTL